MLFHTGLHARIRSLSTRGRVAIAGGLGIAAAGGVLAATLGASAAQIGPVYNSQGNAGVELVNSNAQVRNLTITFYVTKAMANMDASNAIHLEATNSGDTADLGVIHESGAFRVVSGPAGENTLPASALTINVRDTVTLDAYYKPGSAWVQYTVCDTTAGVCANPQSTHVHTWASFRNAGTGIHLDSIVGDVAAGTKVARDTNARVTTYNGTKGYLGAGFWNVRQGIDTSTGDATGVTVLSPNGVAPAGVVTLTSHALQAP